MDVEEVQVKLMHLVAANPTMSQRDLARYLGISVGRTNYCLRALLDKGLVKAGNFRRSQHKAAYLYKLTPSGINELLRAGALFVARKRAEYEALDGAIAALALEIEAMDGGCS